MCMEGGRDIINMGANLKCRLTPGKAQMMVEMRQYDRKLANQTRLVDLKI